MKNTLRRAALVVFWIGVGALIAGIAGYAVGGDARPTLPFVLGLIIVCTGLPAGLFLSIRSGMTEALDAVPRLRPETRPPADAPRELCRIESLRELGVTVQNFHHLFELTVTVFPSAGAARFAVFSQFVTMGQLPGLARGRYAVLATVPGTPPRLILDPDPDARWSAAVRAAAARFDDVPAPPAARAPAKPSTTVTIPPRVGPIRAVLNAVVIVLCVILGLGASAVYICGGVPRTIATAAELPARLTGHVHGLWDSQLLALDIADLRTQLRGRDIEDLVIFDTSYSLSAVSASDPQGEDSYSFRSGDLTLSWTSTTSTITGFGSFTMEDVSAEVVRRAVAKVYADAPGATVSHVAIRPLEGRLVVDVDVEGTYRNTTRRFDATTGEELPEQ